ncbi:MAG: hypothetical protein JO191_11805, partial [Mycobacteriaceae bacterium]|nr:hypothetical protein [Mycobacteriaceae bacterium]
DPRASFIAVNQRLARNDALNQFTTHTATGIYVIAPGAVHEGDWIGRALFS